jgi:hypothetical protein
MPARENISNPPVTDHVKEGIEPKPELEIMVVEDASNKDCEPSEAPAGGMDTIQISAYRLPKKDIVQDKLGDEGSKTNERTDSKQVCDYCCDSHQPDLVQVLRAKHVENFGPAAAQTNIKVNHDSSPLCQRGTNRAKSCG